MSVATIFSQITAVELSTLPSVITAVQAAEAIAPGATGAEKATAVIGAVSAQLETNGNPNVAAISQQVNLVVSLLNLFGVFKHKAA